MSRWITIEAAELAVKALEEENARLKDEVERLRAFATRTIIPNEELQAQVERLTRAANWLLLQWDANHNGGETSRVGSNSINELRNAAKHAAKEGKQSK